MNLTEGMVVADKFRLERMIGQGGMGSVWRAHHVGLDVPCAVKFIEGELAKLEEAQKRFQREAHAAAKLDSPHVVKIYDYGVWQGVPYIAMELLVGQDLGKVLHNAGGKLGTSEVNRIVQQVCRALTKAHGAGIVHRDLKPDNIFIVNDDDGPGTVKILDFGVAKSTSHAIEGSNTKTGAMLGTPYYMSPEQAQGIKSVDGKSDLWSLAVIVFQCITGRLPFESEALGDLLVKIIVSPIPMPSSLGPVPPGFDQWWVRVADRNPENRPANAKAFAESLMLALGQSSVTEVGIDRSKLMKLGGATALMNQGAPPMMNTPPNVGANVPNTPFPASTPNAYVQHQTPANMAGPMPTPGPHASTGATFSGMDASAAVPKKGLPVPLLAGAGALLVVGLALGGYAMSQKSHAGGGTAAASGSAPTAAPSDTVAAKPSAEPPPPATVAATPSATPSAEPSAAPSASVAAAGGGAPTHTNVARPTGGGTGGGKAGTNTAQNTAAGAKPPTGGAATPPPPPPPGPKPAGGYNPGF